MVLCDIAGSCANTPQSSQGARNNATATIAVPIPIFTGIEFRSIMLMFLLRGLTGCSKMPSSKAAGESKPEAYPQGYVEDFDEPRTTLAAFFSSL